ncbi:MAG: hypothetical protein R3F37_00845 [Candidatus Competibacteraceae bacterium]
MRPGRLARLAGGVSAGIAAGRSSTTNDCMPGEQHITLAWGRDYGDVASPGSDERRRTHNLQVSVDVEPFWVDKLTAKYLGNNPGTDAMKKTSEADHRP